MSDCQNLHSNLPDASKHTPKGFDSANKMQYPIKDENNSLLWTSVLVLPQAINFVDGASAPPTENDGDIYVLDTNSGSIEAGWDGAAENDWVRYNATDDVWYAITPVGGYICFDLDTSAYLQFNGTDWASLGGGSNIYTANGTTGAGRAVGITDTLAFDTDTFFISSSGEFVAVNGTSSVNGKKLNVDGGFHVGDNGTGNGTIETTANSDKSGWQVRANSVAKSFFGSIITPGQEFSSTIADDLVFRNQVASGNILIGAGNDVNMFISGANDNIGVGTVLPDSSSILDLSSTSKGFLAPRMDNGQRNAISSPLEGLMIYNTTSSQYESYNGSTWDPMQSSINNLYTNDGTISATRIVTISPSNTLEFSGSSTTTDQVKFTNSPVKITNNLNGGVALTIESTDNGSGETRIGSTSTLGRFISYFANDSLNGLRIESFGTAYASETTLRNKAALISSPNADGMLFTTLRGSNSEDIIFSTDALLLSEFVGNERMRIFGTGDVRIDTDTFYVDASQNNVGIGTAAPNSSYKLDINGAVNLGNASTGNNQLNAGGGVIFEANSTQPTAGGHVVLRSSSASVDVALRIENTASTGTFSQIQHSCASTNGFTAYRQYSNLGSGAELAAQIISFPSGYTSSAFLQKKILFGDQNNNVDGTVIHSENGEVYITNNASTAGAPLAGDVTAIFTQAHSMGVGVGISSVDGSAVMQADSLSKGFLPPRMTQTQRDAISSPAAGLIIYNTTTNVLDFYNGSAWGPI